MKIPIMKNLKNIKLFESFAGDDDKLLSAVRDAASPEQVEVIDAMEAGSIFIMSDIMKRFDNITEETIDKVLRLMVNDVEGDATQLDPKHAGYAEKMGWLDVFESALFENEEFKSEFDSIYSNINTIHLLNDEGYLDGVRIKDGVTYKEINDFLGSSGFNFNSDEDVYGWIKNVMTDVCDFGEKYKKML